MNTQKLEIAISQLERVHRDMNDCANRFILKDAIDQLQEQVKLFDISDVIQRSEQLCEHPEDERIQVNGYRTLCLKCGKMAFLKEN